MPIVQRKQLRQSLGKSYIRDTIVGNLTATGAALNATAYIVDGAIRDPLAFDDSTYQRSWVKVAGFQFRVASFNCYSGALIGAVLAQSLAGSGAEYELHQMIRPSEKDTALNDAVKMLKFRQEISVAGASGMKLYQVPPEVLVIYGLHYADRTATDRDYHDFDSWSLNMTATGRELRISGDITGSQQLIIDALVEPSLGASDEATIWLPSDDWLLTGAAARVYWMMEQKAPGQEANQYKTRRLELTRRFNFLHHYYRPQYNEPIGLPED